MEKSDIEDITDEQRKESPVLYEYLKKTFENIKDESQDLVKRALSEYIILTAYNHSANKKAKGVSIIAFSFSVSFYLWSIPRRLIHSWITINLPIFSIEHRRRPLHPLFRKKMCLVPRSIMWIKYHSRSMQTWGQYRRHWINLNWLVQIWWRQNKSIISCSNETKTLKGDFLNKYLHCLKQFLIFFPSFYLPMQS